MKNYEISNANFALGQLLDEPLKGRFKFKVFNAKSTLEKANEVIVESLDGVTDEEEREEILQEEQEVNIDKFTEEELEQIDLSLRQIAMLKPIIQFKEVEE